ncbi:MAG: AAA family ATPase [Candidatus Natronoplasma sp.]
MIVKEITLDPFGNLSRESFDFEDGKTNVLLGETGAGKTTVFDALYATLFIDSSVRRNNEEYKRFIKKRYPLDGSNVVEVTVKFEHDGDEYELTKIWNKDDKDQCETILRGKTIGVLHGDNKVKEELDNILPSNKGTFKKVLMAYQTKIQDVLDLEENENAEVYSELDEILRDSLAADEISPQEFLSKVEEKFEEYGGRWDFKKERPETKSDGGRYKASTGEIHDAYWGLKDKEEKLKEIESKEEQIEDLNAELEAVREEIGRKETFLEENKKAYEDSETRENLRLKLEPKKEKREELEQDFKKWEEEKESITKNETKIESREKELEEEKERRDELEQLMEIEKIAKDIDNEKEKLEAGELQGDIKAKRQVEFELEKDTETTPKKYTLNKGEEKEIEAKGGISIYTDDVDVKVHSGEGKFKERVEKIERLEDELEEKAEEYDIKTPIEKKNYDDQLQTKEEKIREIERQINKMKDEIKKSKETIEELKERHEVSSKSEIIEKKIRTTEKVEELEEKLEELEDVPEDYEDVSEFREKYKESREKKDELQEEEKDILETLSDMERPSKSSDEVKEEIEQKKKEYKKASKKGEAYKLLKEKTKELLEGGDIVYGQLKKEIEEYFQNIYDEDYGKITMDEADVESLVHPDGYEIPKENLSTGQGDIMALSIRLAMAKYYLQETDGFFVMDDPLVNIDPPRREHAAQIIDDFSKNQQVLIMTCDPNHADMFDDGHVVEI